MCDDLLRLAGNETNPLYQAWVESVCQEALDACTSDTGTGGEGLSSVMDTLEADGNFSLLSLALHSVNLDITLENEEQVFTVFAPTDAAFLALGAGAFNDLISAQSELSDLLLYHVAGPQVLSSEDLASGNFFGAPNLSMLNGKQVKIGRGELILNDSVKIMTADIPASNGVIHVIDVLLEEPAGEQPAGNYFGVFGGTEFGLWEQNGVRGLRSPVDRSLGRFANTDTSLYPFSFPYGGKIEFQGGTDFGLFANVYFKFEKAPNPDTEPSFTTETITVGEFNGETYTVEIPPQPAENTFSSFLFYLETEDVPFLMGNVSVVAYESDPSVGPCEAAQECFSGVSTWQDAGECWGDFHYCLAAPEDPNFCGGGYTQCYEECDGKPGLPWPCLPVHTMLCGVRRAAGAWRMPVRRRLMPGCWSGSDVAVGPEKSPRFCSWTVRRSFFDQLDAITGFYVRPKTAEPWAGFANTDTSLYPFSFPNGGAIKFLGAVDAQVPLIYFKFENAPFPDTEPSFVTDSVVLQPGELEELSVEIPPQDPNQGYASFLLYIEDTDIPVILSDVVVVRAK